MIEIINKETFDFSKIEPNFIYNRIDLFDSNYVISHIKNEYYDRYIEVHIKDNYMELGTWLMHVRKKDIKEISSFLFKYHPKIKYASFHNIISNVGDKKNFYYLELPSTYKEMEMRLTSKSRQRLRRSKRDAAEKYGEMHFTEYSGTIPKEIVEDFFELKKSTLAIEYQLTYKDYLKKYHVSNAYVLSFGEKTAAVFFTCEQCPIVYGENFSYDTDFAYYSPGILIYDLIIQRLIEKGKKIFYLGGGNYEYKKKYNSIEISVREGRIYRNPLIALKYHCLNFYNHHLLWKIKGLKKKIHLSL